MTSSEMRNVLKLMGKKAANASDTLIENTLADILDKDPAVFNETMAMPDFKIRVLIEDLVSINALRIRGGHYMFGDSAIGHDLEAACLYLKDPKNQDIVLSLKSKLKASKK
jgi:O-acetylhomoserine/O-acetylserine sulfhydrylase-like pyridoxal-dependent enzyme